MSHWDADFDQDFEANYRLRPSRSFLNDFSGEESESSNKSEIVRGSTSDEWEREFDFGLGASNEYLGLTPPRQVRREKRREKTPKKLWASSEGFFSSNEKQAMERKRFHSFNRASSNQERTAKRKEKFTTIHSNSDTFGVNDSFYYEIRAANRPPVIRIEIPNTLRSIGLRAPSQVCCNQPEQDAVSKRDVKKFSKKSPLIHNIPTTRLQFHKTFSLLVRLGGRPRASEVKGGLHTEHTSQNAWKADYIEVLWLELKAWHASKGIQEEDSYLEDARLEIDTIFDEVISFNFQKALALLEQSTMISNENRNSHETEAIQQTVDINVERSAESGETSDVIGINDIADELNQHRSAFVSENDMSDKLRDLSMDQDAQVNSTALSEALDRTHQQLAMRAIITLMSKVEHAESLYPTTKALADQHEKYTSVTFVRNIETLLLWLNTSKDLYHRMQLCARFLQIDTDDGQLWQDWIDHGLGLRCVKTRQVYTKRRDSLVKEDDLTLHTTEETEETDAHGQYGHQQRISICGLKPTSTSRYRMFVEKCICQMGLAKLTRRLKRLLHISLWRARQALEVTASAKLDMEKHHNFEKVKMLLLFLEQMANENISGSLFANMRTSLLSSEDFRPQRKVDRGVWSAGFKEMGLPSFLELYLFLVKVPFDLVLDCIRYRLEHQPKGDPSNLSIRQLLQECKEVIYIGILTKYYFQDMSLSVLTADDSHRIDAIDSAISEFEDEMQKMLMLYFEYIQSLFQMLQRLPQASQRLKNVIEEEWEFAKVMCPHIKGGESQAGYRFCVLASGLLESCTHFLESSLDESASSVYYNPENAETPRHKVLEACRNFKQVFNETKQRAAKAIGFAKMLQKDLGIAAEFSIKVPIADLLKLLAESGFMKVDCLSSACFDIYAPEVVSKDNFLLSSMAQGKNSKYVLNYLLPSDGPTIVYIVHVVQLLTVTCGFEDPAKAGPTPAFGYILLLNKSLEEKQPKWNGEVIHVSPTVEITIALAKIEVTELLLISYNAFKTSESRKMVLRTLGPSIEVINEQTSSHEIIADAMVELKETSLELSNVIVNSVAQVANFVDSEATYEMEEQERALIRGSHVETMHVCFNLGFEYFKEITHLITGKRRAELGPKLHNFARMWMNFVTTKVERGRGRQPRWASHGLGFLIVTCEPKNVMYLQEENFLDLKKEMLACVHHIIGRADQGSRSSSPLPIHRGRSYPPTTPKSHGGKGDRALSDLDRRAALSESNTPISASTTSPFDTSIDGSDSEVGMHLSLPPSHLGSRDSSPFSHHCDQNDTGDDSPMQRIRKAVTELEDGRHMQLSEDRIIGKATDRRSQVASELIHFNARRVNFKWQLGRPIGEGQFGKVYTCVNLDTGDIMAMKQIRFNRNDYSTTQEIADEIKNIEGLSHDSLVKYYGVELHRDEMLIFMEYCADGTIADVAKLGLPESMIRVYTFQINKAVHFLHANGIVHRDIKGTNIFVSSDGIIKLGDFGSAVKLKNPLHTMQGEVARTRGVTAAYMAPEVITLDKGRGYGRSADIWSLGCVVIEMATGKRPWSDTENMFSIMYRVGNGDSPSVPESMSEEGKDFLSKCFIRDPRKRWTAEQLEDHAFVKCC